MHVFVVLYILGLKIMASIVLIDYVDITRNRHDRVANWAKDKLSTEGLENIKNR